tara:strand:+ start:179 stop:484 length:306 start_codon:yes stop_codon:yes gene_type:complete
MTETIREKYPDRIPIYLEKREGDSLVALTQKKYLLPDDMVAWQLLCLMRKKMTLSAGKALFLFTHSGALVSSSDGLIGVYNKHKKEDGLLYLIYASENAFG